MTHHTLATLCLAALAAGCQAAREPRPPTPETPHFSVLTYNVNFGLTGDPQALEAIEQAGADLVGLQETNEGWETACREELADDYPHIEFRHAGGGAGGLGVLSRHPFRELDYIAPIGGGWFPAWRLEVDSPIGPVQVFVVHLRPPLSESGGVVSGYVTTPAVREGEMNVLAGYLDERQPTLVLGDFNEGVSGRAIEVLEQRGFRSALPEFDTPQRTWRWTTSLGTIEGQLDHIVYSDELEPLSAEVIPAGRSDHLPVRAVFQLRASHPAPGAGSLFSTL